MDESGQPPTRERLTELVEEGQYEAANSYLRRCEASETAVRKDSMRAIRTFAAENPSALSHLSPTLSRFLTDEERSIRLSTAKLFVTIAAADPESVTPHVERLADRLADADEFYYVRARSAEALGYVALEDPDAVASPEVLADLRIGLSFDEPEVKEKLAKALEFVALGNPGRLRHLVSRLAEHLDDENVLVRYHLCTALTAVGCTYPSVLTEVRPELRTRLTDENELVGGRAAEALGVLARADDGQPACSEDELAVLRDATEPFAKSRALFASPKTEFGGSDEVGTIDGIRATTEAAVDTISSPDSETTCAHCGLTLPENGPPMCPRCGAPH